MQVHQIICMAEGKKVHFLTITRWSVTIEEVYVLFYHHHSLIIIQPRWQWRACIMKALLKCVMDKTTLSIYFSHGPRSQANYSQQGRPLSQFSLMDQGVRLNIHDNSVPPFRDDDVRSQYGTDA